jgi:hypothetical protein
VRASWSFFLASSAVVKQLGCTLDQGLLPGMDLTGVDFKPAGQLADTVLPLGGRQSYPDCIVAGLSGFPLRPCPISWRKASTCSRVMSRVGMDAAAGQVIGEWG